MIDNEYRQWIPLGIHTEVSKALSLVSQARRLDAALEYARWVPPTAALYTLLLKESVQHGDLYAVTQVVEVCAAPFPPSPPFGFIFPHKTPCSHLIKGWKLLNEQRPCALPAMLLCDMLPAEKTILFDHNLVAMILEILS